MKPIIIFLFGISFCSIKQKVDFVGTPQIFAPGIVSVENSEVKITFSKDGKLALWGTIGREGGAGGLDIWMAEKKDSVWINPQPVSFNSAYNDFDPFFSVEGKMLYFFSNRPGGEGGDDIYYVSYDPVTQSFGEPLNMGKNINSSGDEWGPVESTDGKKFMFCTDGKGGKGQHDIFISKKVNNEWGEPHALEAINSFLDDFDPVFLSDGSTIIFSRKISEDEAYLYFSFYNGEGYTSPQKLSALNIPGTWNFGSSVNSFDPDYLYYSTHNDTNSIGKLDIYKVRYYLIELKSK